MIKYILSGLFLLSSAAYISAAEQQKKYAVLVHDKLLNMKHRYKLLLTLEEFKNPEVLENRVKEIGNKEMLNLIPKTNFSAIEHMLSNCSVTTWCVDKANQIFLEINDPTAKQRLDAGTHRLEASVHRGTCT